MMQSYAIKKTAPLLLFFLLLSCNTTDWVENFKEKEKSPFGNYILHNEAKALFNNQKMISLKENIYDYLIKKDSIENGTIENYICIKHNATKYTHEGVVKLLEHVSKGNNAFLAFNSFKDTLKTLLKVATNNLDKNVYNIKSLKKLKGELTLQNTQFAKTTFSFNRNVRKNYFFNYDRETTKVLGTIAIDGENLPNFIKVNYGKGAIFLHTHPIAFTNYYLLKDTKEYVENVFSYLPDATIVWDLQLKSSKYSKKEEETNNVFKFFLEHKTLTWFLWVLFIGLLLFMLFNARRKQRPIPVIDPFKNTTVEFTKTIASLYLKEQDHKNLVDKKIAFFLEKIRSKYLLSTANLNSDFIEKLAAKSGNDLRKTRYLINTIITLNRKSECSEEELVVLHKMIRNFFKK